MKILHLFIRNINSLRGEHTIDFEHDGLGRAGLFAITGPTGSGKSTLLDVISLALYNRIPRLSGSVSKGVIERTGAILTRHTREALAEVTYQCQEGTFTSRWSIGINRNGNLNDYHMEIADGSGHILGIKKKDVPNENARRIGLEYGQFVQAMMLAQGAFAKFLQANKNERTKLLEKLTGGSIYRMLGERAFQKNKAAQATIEKQEDRQRNIKEKLLGEEALKSLETQFSDAQRELETLQKQLKALESQQERKQLRATWQQKATAAQKEATEAGQRLEAFEKEHGMALKRHQDLVPQLEAIRQWEQQSAEHRRLKEEANRLESAIAASHTQWQSARQALVEWLVPKACDVSASDEDATLLEALDGLCQKVNALQQQVEEQQQAFRHEHRQLKQYAGTLSLELPVLDGKQKNLQEQLADAAHRIDRKAREIADAQHVLALELAPHWQQDPARGRQEIADLRDRFHHLQTAQKQGADLDQRLANHQEECQKREALVAAAPQKIQEAAHDVEKKELALRAARSEEENRRLRASLQEHRQNLKAGEACPLCGATEHPWAGGMPAEEPQGTQIAQLEQSQRNAQNHHLSLQAQHEQDKKQLEKLHKDIRELESARTQCEAQINTITQSLPETYRAQPPEKALSTLQLQASKLEEWAQLLQTEAPMAALNHGLAQIRQIVEEGQKLKAQKEALYTGNDINVEARQHREVIQRHRQQHAHHQEQRTKNQRQLERQQKLVAEIDNALLPPLRELGYNTISEALEHRLPETKYEHLRQQRHTIRQRIDQAREQGKQMDAQLSEHPDLAPEHDVEAIAEQRQAVQQKIPEVQQHRDELQSEYRHQHRLMDELKTIEKEIGAQRERNRKWKLLAEYIGDASGDKFSRFAQGLTLRQLLTQANRRLAMLNPRYALDMPRDLTDDKEQQLVAIDKDMGGERRSVRTLSGGESFLISLSLALGLSDLAARQVNIQSLFIDEGFGTLDQETLDATLDILERLQVESEKTIGIISHVDALKDRITHQIQLQPDGQGYSQIRIKAET